MGWPDSGADMKKSECQHSVSTLPYMAWHTDAKRRASKGDKQVKCPVCLKFIWRNDFTNCKVKAQNEH